MSQFKTGQAKVLSATPNKVVLTGAVTTGNIAVGNLWKFQGESPAWFTVASIVDSVSFTLSANYSGAKALDTFFDYVVTKDFTSNLSIPELSAGDVDIRDVYTRAMRDIDALVAGQKKVTGYTEVIQADVNGNIALGVRGATLSQTADIFRIEKSDGTVLVRLTNGGILLLGITTTNANMTLGLTINQGAADNEILALKSSDVAHGVTVQTETDTYGMFQKTTALGGGLLVRGFDDGGGNAYGALMLDGVLGQAANTTKSALGFGVIRLSAHVKLGTGQTVVGADGNLVSFDNDGTTRFLFDAEGSAHADVEWIAFGAHDDLALLEALDRPFDDPIRGEFGAFLCEHRAILQRERVVNFYDDGPRAMVNFTRLAMLHTGAIRQLARRNQELEARVLALTEGRDG